MAKKSVAHWNRQKHVALYLKQQLKGGGRVNLIVLPDDSRYLLSNLLLVNIDGFNRLPEAFGGMDLGTMYRAAPGAYRIDLTEHSAHPEQYAREQQRFVERLIGKALLIDVKPTPLMMPLRSATKTSDLARLFQIQLPQNRNESRLILGDAELIGLFAEDPESMSGQRYDLIEDNAIRVYNANGSGQRQEFIGLFMTLDMTKQEFAPHYANPLAIRFLTKEERERAFVVAYGEYLELQRQAQAERDKQNEAALAEALVKQGVPANDAEHSAAVAAGSVEP